MNRTVAVRVALVAALCIPLPAQAMGCFPVSLADGIARDFARRDADPQPFVMLRGTLAHDTAYRTGENAFRFEADFEGRQLVPGGESEVFRTTVIVFGQCINGDCGSLSVPGTEQYFLALFDDGGFRIEVAPCAFFPIGVSPITTAAVAACLSGNCPAN